MDHKRVGNDVAAMVYEASVLPGWDQTNDVQVVEQGRFDTYYLSGSGTKDISQNAGGYLQQLVITVATTVGVITVFDDTTGGTSNTIAVFGVGCPAGTYPFNRTLSAGLQVNFSSASDIGYLSYRPSADD
jgi:hypothetical protein